MTSENPGLKIFNNWIKNNNQIYKFTKDSKYDDILPVMFKTISSEQPAVLKSFRERNLIRPDTILILKEIIKKKKTEEEEEEREKLAREEEEEEEEEYTFSTPFWNIEENEELEDYKYSAEIRYKISEGENSHWKEDRIEKEKPEKSNKKISSFGKNELPGRDVKSLENVCKKVLNINENVPVVDVADFLETNEIFDLDSLFLVNFKNKPWISLSSNKIRQYYHHEILGFKEMSGRYGNYYLIYCKIFIPPKEYEYMILFSNKKIAEKIDKTTIWLETKEVAKGVKFYKDYSIKFTPKELDYFKGICYRKVHIY